MFLAQVVSETYQTNANTVSVAPRKTYH